MCGIKGLGSFSYRFSIRSYIYLSLTIFLIKHNVTQQVAGAHFGKQWCSFVD